MRTVDIHNDNQNENRVRYDIDNEIAFAKREKDKLLCLIVGYGSSGKSHKVKNYAIMYLDELKEKKRIVDYILGNDIDIFNPKYQTFKGRENIPEDIKKSHNLGIIIVKV